MSKKSLVLALSLFVFTTLFHYCGNDSLPLPFGHLRLEYPKHSYQSFTSDCPFSFEFSQYAKIIPRKENCWLNIYYPKMKAVVHITYYPVKHNLIALMEQSQKMVYEHTIKADGITTKSFEFPEKRVFGNLYTLTGESATNLQFYATDSVKHFVSSHIYFRATPNPDSLAPAVDYIKKDIIHMIESWNWKK